MNNEKTKMMFLRKFQVLTLSFMILFGCGWGGLFKYVHLRMTNTLGDGKTMNVHCVVNNGQKMDDQQIPNNGTIMWKFKYTSYGFLTCDATVVNEPGIPLYHFLAFEKDDDTCRDSCSMNFTKDGVFKLNRVWMLISFWPIK